MPTPLDKAEAAAEKFADEWWIANPTARCWLVKELLLKRKQHRTLIALITVHLLRRSSIESNRFIGQLSMAEELRMQKARKK